AGARRPVDIELVDRGANVAGIAPCKAIVDQGAVAIADGERRAQISPALAVARNRAVTQKASACGMASQESRDCLRFDLHGLGICLRHSGKESCPYLGNQPAREADAWGVGDGLAAAKGGEGARGTRRGVPPGERLSSPFPHKSSAICSPGCIAGDG